MSRTLDRADLKRLIGREVRRSRARMRGVVASVPQQKFFNPSGLQGLTWVVDVDIGQGRLLRNVPIKINGPQARLYAKLGMPVFLERDSGQRWQIISPADRLNGIATVQIFDEDLTTTAAGDSFGVTVTREPFEFYKGEDDQQPEFFFDPSADTDVILWIDAGHRDGNRPKLEADGAAIPALFDRSTAQNKAQQGTAANRPFMRQNNAGANGRPAADFDTTDMFNLVNNITGSVFSIFIYMRRDSTGAASRSMFQTHDYLVRASTSGTDQWSVGAGGGQNFSGFTLGNTTYALIEVVATAYNSISMYQDGVAGNVGTLAAAGNAFGASSIAAQSNSTEFLDGRIAEILVLDRAVSTADRQAIEAYFEQKYDVRFSLWHNLVTPFPAIIRRDAQGNPI
jgi:hypothetical protein